MSPNRRSIAPLCFDEKLSCRTFLALSTSVQCITPRQPCHPKARKERLAPKTTRPSQRRRSLSKMAKRLCPDISTSPSTRVSKHLVRLTLLAALSPQRLMHNRDSAANLRVHIDEGDIIYDASLNQTSIGNNANKVITNDQHSLCCRLLTCSSTIVLPPAASD